MSIATLSGNAVPETVTLEVGGPLVTESVTVGVAAIARLESTITIAKHFNHLVLRTMHSSFVVWTEA